MKVLVRFSVLFMLISVLAFTGCFLTDDDDDNYVAPTGEIMLSAVIDAAGAGITPAMRGSVAGELRAAGKSTKFKALIKIVGTKVATQELGISDDNTKLTMAETKVTAATGKQQVTIEVVPVEDESKPVLKTVLVAEVVSGTPVEKKDAAVDTKTTAQAVAYEAWVEKDTTKTIDDFVATVDPAKITALETQIKTTLSSGGDLTATAITSEAKEVAAATPVPTEPTPVPLTTEETVKAAYNLWLRTLASATQRLTPDAAAAIKIDDMLDADFMWEGFNKTTWAGLMKAPPADFFDTKIHSFSGDSTLTKVDDSTYVVTFNGTISGLDKAGTSYSTAIDGTKNAFALTGAANQTAFSMTGTVKHPYAALIVKKGTDGIWRISGNRVKASSYLELVIANKWINGSTGSGINADLWKGSQTISSAIISGGVLNATGTINLTAKPDETDHWGWAGGPNYSWIQTPAGQTIAANQAYVFTVAFADGSQTYTYNVPALPTSYAAPTITLTSPAPGQLSATWTAEPSTSFSEYWVGINYVDGPGGNMGDEVYSASILSASQNQLQRTGLTEGQWVRVEANVKTKTGFCYRTNSELQISSTNRLSGSYRIFSYSSGASDRWLGAGNFTVSGNTFTVQDVFDSNNDTFSGNGTFTEADGLVTLDSANRRAVVSPSGNYFAIHEYNADDPCIDFAVKLPTNATNALLNGDYRFYTIVETVGANGANPSNPRFQVEVLRFDGNGNGIGVSQILNEDNRPAQGAFTYSIAADGKVTSTNPSNYYYQVSADGNVMIMAEYGTDYREFAIGVKIGSGMSTADLPSTFVAMSHLSGAGTPYSLSESFLGTLSNGISSVTDGKSETGNLSNESATITVSADGTYTDTNHWRSLSPDKEFLVFPDIDSDGHYFNFAVKR